MDRGREGNKGARKTERIRRKRHFLKLNTEPPKTIINFQCRSKILKEIRAN